MNFNENINFFFAKLSLKLSVMNIQIAIINLILDVSIKYIESDERFMVWIKYNNITFINHE